MNTQVGKFFGLLALGAWLTAPAVLGADVEPGFASLFNGTDLTDWEGSSDLWSVQDGAITGQTTKEKPTPRNTFLIWRKGTVADFELRFSFKTTPGDTAGFVNSGVQYRSRVTDPAKWVVNGYQADIEAGSNYTGILYEEGGRGILAQRGQMVNIEADGKLRILGSMGASADVESVLKKDGWNDYIIIARGNHLTHIINGRVAVDVTDDQVAKRAASGILALQVHAGPPMKIQFKNLRLKAL